MTYHLSEPGDQGNTNEKEWWPQVIIHCISINWDNWRYTKQY